MPPHVGRTATIGPQQLCSTRRVFCPISTALFRPTEVSSITEHSCDHRSSVVDARSLPVRKGRRSWSLVCYFASHRKTNGGSRAFVLDRASAEYMRALFYFCNQVGMGFDVVPDRYIQASPHQHLVTTAVSNFSLFWLYSVITAITSRIRHPPTRTMNSTAFVSATPTLSRSAPPLRTRISNIRPPPTP